MAPTISAAPLLLLLLGSAASYLLPAPRGPAVRAHPRHSAAQLVAGAPIGSLEEQQSQAYEQQQSIESEETYKIMMRALLDTEESLEAQVSANYAMFDYRFLQLLEEVLLRAAAFARVEIDAMQE